MQTHAKHQKNDTHFRELTGEIKVAHKTGRSGCDKDTRKQIAHQRGHPNETHQIAENQR